VHLSLDAAIDEAHRTAREIVPKELVFHAVAMVRFKISGHERNVLRSSVSGT
jgi:hypothetical protein